jgi:thiol:disulfide interchange protein DsbD
MKRFVPLCWMVCLVAALLAVGAAQADGPQRDLFAKYNEAIPPKKVPAEAKDVKDLIDFYVFVTPKEVRRGQTARVDVTGVPREGHYTYSMTRITKNQIAKQISRFVVDKTPELQPLAPILETDPHLVKEERLEGSPAFLKHDRQFTWSFEVLVRNDASVGSHDFTFSVDFQVCNLVTGQCTPGTYPLKATILVSGEEAVDPTSEVKSRAEQPFPPPSTRVDGKSDGTDQKSVEPKQKSDAPSISTTVGLPRDYQASLERVLKQLRPYVAPDQDSGLMAFVLAGMFWGFVSLITPCVFPMIPITVSFFIKQSEKEHHKPVTMALVYCGTIIIVLTIAAAALLNFFSVLSRNPLMNFGLGLLFIFFALSLFGMYDIELPSFLARYTSERESRGGMVGTVFMALTFTIISFACVAPFLGGFGGTATAGVQRPWWHAILGGLAFSTTFASPFFILALFPTLLRAMPKSGAWLNSVKVVMGFLELAAAFKFFRAGELVGSATPSIFTFDFVLGLWIALCVLCGLYLLGIYRLPHDSPVEHLSVPRMLFSFLFLGLGFYLMPALFSPPSDDGPPRPAGGVYAWVNSFLLPEFRHGKDEVWTGNLENAIAQAREHRRKTGQPKLIFVDVTGKS